MPNTPAGTVNFSAGLTLGMGAWIKLAKPILVPVRQDFTIPEPPPVGEVAYHEHPDLLAEVERIFAEAK